VRRPFVVVLLALAVVSNGSLAQAQSTVATIFSTTLMEANQKTAEVSTQELQRVLTDGGALVFDARPPMEYATSHIPGPRNVGQKPGTPISEYISDAAEIERQVPDKNAALILYCNGPFCGKSERLSEDLLAAGHTNVRRYQLGAPTWRALVGTMEIELDGARYVWESDHTRRVLRRAHAGRVRVVQPERRAQLATRRSRARQRRRSTADG
jgi:rhodanese-related sulfurtransferase